MIWIILAAVSGALVTYFLLRQKDAINVDSLEEYPVEYETKRKVRSDKGKKRGPYNKGATNEN